jgi:hypothetical protein
MGGGGAQSGAVLNRGRCSIGGGAQSSKFNSQSGKAVKGVKHITQTTFFNIKNPMNSAIFTIE